MRYQYHDRQRAYASLLELTAEVRSLDHRLSIVARGKIEPRDDRRDGYPGGGDGTGRSSGVSDPTASAVEQRNRQADELREYADDAIASVFEALEALKAAQASARKALDPPRPAEPEKVPAPKAIFCVSCARPFPKELKDEHKARKVGESITFEPRHGYTNRSRNDLCSWCLVEWDASGDDGKQRTLPDIRLVIWRDDHPGRHVTTRVRAEVLGKKCSGVA